MIEIQHQNGISSSSAMSAILRGTPRWPDVDQRCAPVVSRQLRPAAGPSRSRSISGECAHHGGQRLRFLFSKIDHAQSFPSSERRKPPGSASSRTSDRCVCRVGRCGSNQPKPRVRAGRLHRACRADARGVNARSSEAGSAGMGFARHGSRGPTEGRSSPADQLADIALVEFEGHQRRGAVAGQAEVVATLGRQVLQLLVGRVAVAAIPSILKALSSRLVGVQPVVGLREADGAFADAQASGTLALGRRRQRARRPSSQKMPPQALKPVGHQGASSPKRSTHAKLERFSRSISDMMKLSDRCAEPSSRQVRAAERAFGERRAGSAPRIPGKSCFGAGPGTGSRPSRSTSCSSVPWIRLDVPKSSTMQSVLTSPGYSSGSTVRRPAPDHLDHGGFVGAGPQQTTQEVGGWSQPSVSTATLTMTRISPEA